MKIKYCKCKKPALAGMLHKLYNLRICVKCWKVINPKRKII